MSADARVLDLVERHLAGELAGADEDELAARLRTEPSARELFRRQAALDHHLRRLARPEDDLPLWPGVRQRLRAAGSSGRFHDGVMSAVAAVGARPVPGPTARSRPPSARRRLVLAAGLVFAAAVAGCWWWFGATAPPAPRIADLAGTVTLERAGRPIVPEGAAFRAGDRLELAAGARVRLDLPRPGGTLDLAGPAVLRRPDDRARLVLEEGEATCSFAHRRDAFELATAQVAVRVRGTRYRLVADAGGSLVAVEEGTVAVQPVAGAATEVTTGHVAVATIHGPLQVVPQPPIAWTGPGFHPAVLAAYRRRGMLLSPADLDDATLLFSLDPLRQRPWFTALDDGRPLGRVPGAAVVDGAIRLRAPAGEERQVTWTLPPLPDAFAVELQLLLDDAASIKSVVHLDRYRPTGDLGAARPFRRSQGGVRRPPGRIHTSELFRRVGTTEAGLPIFEVLARLDDTITNRHWLVGPIRAYGLCFSGACHIEAIRVVALPPWDPGRSHTPDPPAPASP